MGRLIRLSRNGPSIEQSSSDERGGDSDLVPVAIILWVGSLMRVVAGAVGEEVFRTEGTLALLCVICIPCWMLWSWVQAEKPALVPDASVGADGTGRAETPRKSRTKLASL